MNRRGMTTIETIGGFVLVIVLIFSMIVIYNNFFEQTEVDIAGFAACAARGVQAGGRGECSVDAACNGVEVKSGEYASYLGVQCTGKEPGVEPNPNVPEKKYCCVIIPRYVNPPAGTLAESQIENHRKWCESTSPFVTGKAVGVMIVERGEFCYDSGYPLLESTNGVVRVRYFPNTPEVIATFPETPNGQPRLSSQIRYTLPGKPEVIFEVGIQTVNPVEDHVDYSFDIEALMKTQLNAQNVHGVKGNFEMYYYAVNAQGKAQYTPLIIPFTIP